MIDTMLKKVLLLISLVCILVLSATLFWFMVPSHNQADNQKTSLTPKHATVRTNKNAITVQKNSIAIDSIVIDSNDSMLKDTVRDVSTSQKQTINRETGLTFDKNNLVLLQHRQDIMTQLAALTSDISNGTKAEPTKVISLANELTQIYKQQYISKVDMINTLDFVKAAYPSTQQEIDALLKEVESL